MKKIPDDFIINLAFRTSIDKEEMLISKYDEYMNAARSDEMKDMLREFKKYSLEHIKMIKDKVMHFNIEE